MDSDYETWLRREEEIERTQERRLQRELLGEYVDTETGCPVADMEAPPPARLLVDGEPIDYSGLPANHRETVRLYLEHGYQPGSGWTAILSWHLDAILRVDDETAKAMPQIVRWLRNHAPGDAIGSPAKVDGWMRARRAERAA